MNNILDFQEYRNQVRLYEESLVKEQIMQPIEEGLLGNIRNKMNLKATAFVKAALRDEIEMGKKLNEQIQESVNQLKEHIDEMQDFVDKNGPKKSNLFKNIEKIFDDIHKSSFELLEILSGLKINFADYVQNAAMATFVNFGVIFIPIRSTFLLKKSYKYFIGIIKNTIRRDLLMLMLNFDQFENTVLIQSLEDDEQDRFNNKYDTQLQTVSEIERNLISSFRDKKGTISQKQLDNITKVTREMKKTLQIQQKTDSYRRSSIGFDSKYDNTYTKTLDQLKNYVLEDDSKYLDSIKRSMQSLALDEVDTKTYVELLIAAAEECAYEVSNAIHTNFIEKVSVFKLANQKTLIDLVKKDKELCDKEAERKFKEEKEELEKLADNEYKECIDEKGEELFEKVIAGEDVDDEDFDKEDKSYGGKALAAFNKLDKIEYKGNEYDAKNVLLGWLASGETTWKNLKDNKDKFNDLDLLKIVIDYDGDGFGYFYGSEKYIDALTIALPEFKYVKKEEKRGKEPKITNCGFVRKDGDTSPSSKLITSLLIDEGTPNKIDEKKKRILVNVLKMISKNISPSPIKTIRQKEIIEAIENLCVKKVHDTDDSPYGISYGEDIEKLNIIIGILDKLDTDKEIDGVKTTSTK